MKSFKIRNGLRGFTLVETAIVVTVGAIILSAGLSGYKTYLQKERYDTTKERLSKIAKALDDYRKLPSNVNHNIPCPAPLYAAPGSAGYGHDVTINLTTGLPLGAGQQCDDAPLSGLLGTERRKSGASGVEKDVRIGAVPFATLGLSAEDTQDAWGQRFIYAVSEPLANYATPYSASGGTITVKDAGTTSIGGVGLVDKMPFFVYTSGKNGGGGITADGSNFYNACPSIGLDSLNCAWKSTTYPTRVDFRSTTYSESGGATEFDDQIIYDYADDDLVTKCNDLSDCISDNASFIYLGEGAGNTTTAGPKNTAMGINSLAANTIGNLNTAMGWSALQNNTSAAGNSAFGSSALQQNTTGGFNTAMGLNALTANTTAVGNSAFGSSALSSNTTGTDNTAMGLRALTANTTSPGNSAFGGSALSSNTIGGFNTAVGLSAMLSNTNGGSNVAVGFRALLNNTGGGANVAVGVDALRNDNSSMNTAVGVMALGNGVSFGNNTAVGANALQNNTAAGNTAVGSGAGAGTMSGTNNTVVGAGSLQANGMSGSDNTVVGGLSMSRNTSGAKNTVVGSSAMSSNTSGNDNVAVGSNTLSSNTTGARNTAVGRETLIFNTTGFDNTAVGRWALYGNSTGFANVAVGQGAMESGNGSRNTVVGEGALRFGQGNSNVAIGNQALGTSGTPGNNNVIIGAGAAINNKGSNNVAIGATVVGGTGSRNVVIGYGASAGDQAWNVAIGAGAKTQLNRSVAIGQNANARFYSVAIGDGAIADNRAVAIGTNARAGTGSIAIGADAVGFWSPPGNAGSGEIKFQAINNLRVARLSLGDDWHGPSDRRLKKDIKDSDLGLAFIEKLRPVSYRMKGSDTREVTYGFIAQEVEKALDGRETSIIARLQDKMKTYIMSKGALIPSIVKAVQEIAARLNPLEKTVAAQSAKIEALEKLVKEEREISAQQQAKIQALAKIVESMTTDKALPKQVNYHR